MCAVSLVASARPMAIQLPKLPDLDLPNFGKKKTQKAAASPSSDVKVRAARGGVPTGSQDAPTIDEITGKVSQKTIDAGAGFKRYPQRRMPGANMDGWKKIAKDITPDF